MWHDWLLYLNQVPNHSHMSIIISDQDEDLLHYLMDLKISEGD